MQCSSIGEDPDDVGPPLNLSINRSSGLVLPTFAPMRLGEVGERADLLTARRIISATTGDFGSSMAATVSAMPLATLYLGELEQARLVQGHRVSP
jgi:hypothetical protein